MHFRVIVMLMFRVVVLVLVLVVVCHHSPTTQGRYKAARTAENSFIETILF